MDTVGNRDAIRSDKLHEAAKHGNCENVMCILQDSPDETQANVHGFTALEEAVRYNKYHVFSLLYHPKDFIKFTNTNVKPYTQLQFNSFLNLSLRRDQSDLRINKILLHDCDRIAQNDKNQTALMLAIARYDIGSIETLLMCEDAMRQMCVTDAEGNTCFHQVLFKIGNCPEERCLLEKIFMTLVTVLRGSKDGFAEGLLNMTNVDGETALYIAVRNRLTISVWILMSFKINPFLCINKNDETSQSYGVANENALFAAVKCHNPLIAICVLTRGEMNIDFNIMETDTGGRTLLIAALQTGNFKVAKYLIDTASDHQSMDGNTALHWAAYHGNYELCSLLLKTRGFNTKKNNENRTPFEMAFAIPTGQDHKYSTLTSGRENGKTRRAPREGEHSFEKCQTLLRSHVEVEPRVARIRAGSSCSHSDYLSILEKTMQL